ncbi:MAG: glutamine--fructose-6-phosphate transaminase (isomerizing) [Bacteroidales bacterium]|nr:glutamine--fructose-6-phosphate transaminase (isomerizing) [Bacteroidales bacterium]
MCGIVGYNGNGQASPILLECLSKLEYRGYDSAGIAVRSKDGKISVVKAKGRLKILSEKVDGGRTLPGNIGIGHTRWATHGEPSEANAHPHISGNEMEDTLVVGVHNGIIENYQELKEMLTKAGYIFYSQTDTEIAIKLVDYYYREFPDPKQALSQTMMRLRGSYALALLFKDYPDMVWAARKDSPMIIGVKDDESFLASDVPAILKYTRDIYYVGNMEIACLGKGSVSFYDIDCNELQKDTVTITWDADAAEKGGFEHFMIKEIHEEPRAISDTLNSIVKDDRIDLSASGLTDDLISGVSDIRIVACGSAWHVGMQAKYVIEDIARIPVGVELASEFRYSRPILGPGTLVIIISQSGETADSLAALREAKSLGVKTLAIVNVLGSSIAREADYNLYTLAGPEIAVATTKAYSAQLATCYAIAVQFARVRGLLDDGKYAYYISELLSIPAKAEGLLEDKERIQWFAAKYANAHDAFFIGRGIDYSIALEGSLKMKEVSYIHSEAYAAGELKHGTISLIENKTLLVGILTQNRLFEKTVSNMVECKSRGAFLMAVATAGHYEIEDTADFTVYIPRVDEHFAGILAIIPLQLFGYYTSVSRGLDVDKPRNLAKSVTVE